MKELIRKYFLFIIILPVIYSACEECEECGPSQKEPVVKIRFYNIDSLLKVNEYLDVLEDSLDNVNQRIEAGDTTLNEVRVGLEKTIVQYSEVKQDINNGKIKVDEIYGVEGYGPILFRDSTSNDSLTIFNIPLDMNNNESIYTIHINERVDELGISYQRNIFEGNNEILMNMYDIQLISTTYDSANIKCDSDSCINNETTIYLYF